VWRLFPSAALAYKSRRSVWKENRMTAPAIAAKQPAEVTLEAGKTYAWCVCGLSQKQPFCDGTHKTTELKPLVFKQEQTKTAWLCQCKQTKNRPFCDGTHKTL
jgi:CDGSH-type Zn-finger protein